MDPSYRPAIAPHAVCRRSLCKTQQMPLGAYGAPEPGLSRALAVTVGRTERCFGDPRRQRDWGLLNSCASAGGNVRGMLDSKKSLTSSFYFRL